MHMQLSTIEFKVIGKVISPYKQKFSIPRQPSLAPSAKGRIELYSPFNNPQAVKGLKDFSHIWITFIFHKTMRDDWSPTVRPPRLGGNERVGVFATRSTFRPNPIGLSVVKLEDVIIEEGKSTIIISDFDLLDETPIIDIKPYLPYVDAVSNAFGSYADQQPEIHLAVKFSDRVETFLADNIENHPQLRSLLIEVLQQDPRPAYKKNKVDKKIYAVQLFDLDITWQVNELDVTVIDIAKLN